MWYSPLIYKLLWVYNSSISSSDFLGCKELGVSFPVPVRASAWQFFFVTFPCHSTLKDDYGTSFSGSNNVVAVLLKTYREWLLIICNERSLADFIWSTAHLVCFSFFQHSSISDYPPSEGYAFSNTAYKRGPLPDQGAAVAAFKQSVSRHVDR